MLPAAPVLSWAAQMSLSAVDGTQPGHIHPASPKRPACVLADDAYVRLSPDGLSLNGEGATEGWLEHHMRKMCKALRPEVEVT